MVHLALTSKKEMEKSRETSPKIHRKDKGWIIERETLSKKREKFKG
jgi:hypothetical protein